MRLPGIIASTLISVVVSFQAISVRAADLASAKALYASAAYEDALAMLASLESTESVEQVNQIRALCYLALGQSADAQKAVEQIVAHNPGYQLENAEVSPKLVTLFHEVRRRALPGAARALYVKAKASYDAKHWADAERDFKSLLQITADPDMAGQQEAVADLRQLGEGFLKLSETENAADARRAEEAKRAEEARRAEEAKRAEAEAAAAAAQERAAAVPPSTPPAASGAAPAPAGTAPPAARAPAAAPTPAAPPIPSVPVYTALDPTVKPPVELRRVMPRWTPANKAMAAITLNGLLEIVIDETGGVISAAMAKTVTPNYDQVLLAAARSWRYSPATKDGKPVRYRQVLEIVLRPSTLQE